MFQSLFCAALLAAESIAVPILMYHDFTAGEPQNPWQVSSSRLEEHLSALTEAGYETVSLADLADFVSGEASLPEKCAVLTADDGYSGVTEIALPLCDKYGMSLSCAVIGSAVKREGHFDPGETGFSEIPRTLELVSHGYDLHRLTAADQAEQPEQADGIPLLAASDDPALLLTEDAGQMRARFGEEYPMLRRAFAYPYGAYTAESDAILRELGFEITLTCDPGCARIVQGDPGCLYGLPRLTVTEDCTGEELLRRMNDFRNIPSYP